MRRLYWRYNSPTGDIPAARTIAIAGRRRVGFGSGQTQMPETMMSSNVARCGFDPP